jgi:hypothetical protein
MRPGCDRDVAARLTFDPVGCAVWLDPPVHGDEPVQQVCSIHAATLTVPLGWTVTDRRFEAPATPSVSTTPAGPPSAVSAEPVSAEPEAAEPEAAEPEAVEPEAAEPPVTPATDVSEPEEVQPAVVVRRRRSERRRPGLLDRALRYSGPQQSVLTQPPGTEDAVDGTQEPSTCDDAAADPHE